MTGGRVVILGPTGRNFAAGMSGGLAYVLDEKGSFKLNTNLQMVDLETLGEEDEEEVKEVHEMIRRHAEYTKSDVAWRVLDLWDELLPKFVRVIPKDYKRMLLAMKRAHSAGLSGEEAIQAAFEENKNDLARVAGN